MKLLVSACLLGHKVRYDGSDKDRGDGVLKDMVARGCAVLFCPEVAGGLSVPRLPAELQRGDGDQVIAGLATVIDKQGNDVTEAFLTGARKALAFAQREGIRVAILKSRSPSCGKEQIYDGTFSQSLVPSRGVTAALLERHGIRVFCEDEIATAVAYAQELENAD